MRVKTYEQLATALALGTACLTIPSATANVLTVCPDGSADYTRIQDAIDAAVDGDVVELCDTFFPVSNAGLTDFRGKAITVRSASGDPELCTMHARFLFLTGEGSSSVLAGVTMTWGGEIGTIWIEDASPTFEDVRIVDSANLASGGVTMRGSNAEFRRCVIAGNSATHSEGGSTGAVDCHSSSPRFENCAILGNHALFSAGGVRCTFGSPTLVRCTIAGNRSGANGGGILLDAGHLTLENCILWGNCAGTDGDEAFVAAGGTLTVICCDVDSTGFSGAGTFEYQGGNLFVDPLFCAPISCQSAPTSAGDYRLAQNSPCLSAPGCGLIGAFGQGCGVIAVEGWSWGRIKALHR